MTVADNQFLLGEYAKIDYASSSVTAFMAAVLAAMRRVVPMTGQTSILDFGCGRGYFVKFLRDNGFPLAAGAEPSPAMRRAALCDGLIDASFETNPFADSSHDIVFTCHTLHHLPDPRPSGAVREMLRIARGYVVIVEVNNTNLPMFARSLLHKKDEENAWRYNLSWVRSLLGQADGRIAHHAILDSCYLSGDSLLYRLLSRCGQRPYNITILAKS